MEVTHSKTHAEDCDSCVEGNPAQKEALIDLFERRIFLEGELTDDDRTALLRIADKCPVHRTLEANAAITTVLG